MKTKAFTRRLLAVVAATVLMLTVFASFAVSAVGREGGYTVTIRPDNGTATPTEDDPETLAERFWAYQIFSGEIRDGGTVDMSGVLSDIIWGASLTETGEDGKEVLCGDKFITYLLESESDVEGVEAFQQLLKDELSARNITEALYNTKDAARAVARVLGNEDEESDVRVRAFARLAFNYFKSRGTEGNLPEPTKKSIWNEDAGAWKFDFTDQGYYLFVDTFWSDATVAGGVEASAFILGVFGDHDDVEVEMKPSLPTPDKEILSDDDGDNGNSKGDSYEVGDTVNFRLSAKLPENYGEYEKYTLNFVDTMSKGLTYTEGSVKVFIRKTVTEGDETFDVQAEISTGYTVSSQTNENGETVLRIEFADLTELSGLQFYKLENGKPTEEAYGKPTVVDRTMTVYVDYAAVLNSDAVLGDGGNPNTLFLEFSNNPSNEGLGKSEEKIVYVFTFGLDVTKVASDKSSAENKLEGAEFKLYREVEVENEDGTRASVRQYAMFKRVSPEDETVPPLWMVDKWVDEDKLTAEQQALTILTSDENGRFQFGGLDANVWYTIIETKAPAGYDNMTPVQFRFTATFDEESGKLLTLIAEVKVDGIDNVEYVKADNENPTVNASVGLVPTTLVNYPSPTLPGTGGIGGFPFYIAGIALLAAAVVLLFAAGEKKATGK